LSSGRKNKQNLNIYSHFNQNNRLLGAKMKKTIILALFLLFLSMAYSAYSSSNSTSISEWRMYSRTLDNSRYYPAKIDISHFGLLWSYDLGSNIEVTPAIAEGIVYVGNNKTNIYALNATTGSKIWNTTLVQENLGYYYYTSSCSSAAVSNGIVYVTTTERGGGGNNFFALNASTSTQIWSRSRDESNCFFSPTINEDILYEFNYNADSWGNTKQHRQQPYRKP
jgi:outer membrane protein assembly factor BamB